MINHGIQNFTASKILPYRYKAPERMKLTEAILMCFH